MTSRATTPSVPTIVTEGQRTKVIVVTMDILGKRMAGPAIRAWEMAKALSAHSEVKLLSTQKFTGVSHPDFAVVHASLTALKREVRWADVIVFQGHVLRAFPWIMKTDKVIVADLYDPMHLEVLEQGKDMVESDRRWLSIDTSDVMNEQIARADFMLCASEKQRDLWLGALGANFRINPQTYDHDPNLSRLLEVVPFGIADEAPVQKAHGIKGVVPGISESDKVVIWGGGIYNWFDPLTLVAAIGKLAARHPDLRMYFLGAKHPNPDVPAQSMAVAVREESERLGLTGSHVFFHEEWVPYDDRADWLMDADAGVSCHLSHLETAFSFRTRILDYLWTSLPIITTDGDTFGQLVTEHELGRAVPPQDADALAEAIEAVVYDEEANARFRANVAEYAELMRWARVLKPLSDFVVAPRRAADLLLEHIPTKQEAELIWVRDNVVPDQHRQLVELHANVGRLVGHIANLDARIAELEAAVADKDRQIVDILASTSWKFSRPVRVASRWTARLRGQG